MAYTTIDDPTAYFQTALYSGNAGTQSITNDGNSDLQPDWVWIKQRSGTQNHNLQDSVRGSTKIIKSNTTADETTDANGVTSFNTDGFSIGTRSDINQSGTYVAWQWKAGGSASSNEDGSITSTVSANSTSGFSIVSFTGTGSALTAGHGLGVKPSMIIAKSTTIANNWIVQHGSLGATNTIFLDNTNASQTGTVFWNDTEPTSSVFSLGNWNGINTSGSGIIAYCFADTGNKFFKAGKYTGNGSASGPYIYTGHKPAAIIIKRTDVAKNWYINDNLREGYNNDNPYISPNLSVAETGGTEIDILSNGFRITASGTGHNQSGGTYIYASIAANPFVTSSGVPACAR